MYQQHHHHHWANSTCYCVDGDAILGSRPDAVLANGGAFPSLPPPSSSSYVSHYSQPPPAIVPAPPMAGMAAAAAATWALSTAGDVIVRDREEEQSQRAAVATRYSAEERRERIDKYRSKRNQRNFQKKITYACRKTLADSRPRVKGRFARNAGDYTEAEAEAEADHHVHVPESESPAARAEWWPAVQEEGSINLAEAELCGDDDEMLAAYLGVSSISIADADHHYSCHP